MQPREEEVVMQPGRDFLLLEFSNWVLVKEVAAMTQLQLLCCAPCWLTLFFPGKENWLGFRTAVCYYVQCRYFFWQGFFHLVCVKVETLETFGSANALLWSSKNDVMVARCSSLLIFIPWLPGIRTMIAFYHWIWKLLQFTWYFSIAFDVGEASGNTVSVLGSGWLWLSLHLEIKLASSISRLWSHLILCVRIHLLKSTYPSLDD